MTTLITGSNRFLGQKIGSSLSVAATNRTGMR